MKKTSYSSETKCITDMKFFVQHSKRKLTISLKMTTSVATFIEAFYLFSRSDKKVFKYENPLCVLILFSIFLELIHMLLKESQRRLIQE